MNAERRAAGRRGSRIDARGVPAVIAFMLASAACGTKSAEHAADAGRGRDGAELDAAAEAGDATMASSVVDAGHEADTGESMQHLPVDSGGSTPCISSSSCTVVGDICCASIGGLLKKSVCTPPTGCAGGAEACQPGAPCVKGTCERYDCTENGVAIKSVVYACAQPFIPDGQCSLTPNLDGGPAGDGGGSDGAL